MFEKYFDLKTLNGTNGFVIPGIDPDMQLGTFVSMIGDANNDGILDFVIAPSVVNNGQGSSYIIFGQKDGFQKNYDLKSLNGANDFSVIGLKKDDFLGGTTKMIGDVNSDGKTDIAIGASNVNVHGSSYVIYGKNPLRFINNQLSIVQGETILLSSEHLKAVDLNKGAPQDILSFRVSDLQGGQFELLNQSGAIANFTQQQIINNQVYFIQDKTRSVSYKVSVSNGFVNILPAQANITFHMAPPFITNNQITIIQGKSVLLALENLSATDFNFPMNTLVFSVSHVEGGQFERLNKPGVSITVFTQQEVIDKQIQFAQDDSIGAGYKVVVTDGNNLSSIPSEANVTFAARPILEKPQLFIKQGGSVILNKTHINATDDTTPDSRLMITATNVKHGQFEYNDQPDIAINYFTQENITKSAVRFKTDGGYEKPFYELTVEDDDDLTDGPKAADVIFHDKPQIGNNKLTVRDGDTTIVVRSDLSATEMYTSEEKLEFEISNIEHGEFRWKNQPNNAKTRLAITKFFQKNITDQQVQFTHDGSGVAPTYAVTVSDGELASGKPQNATITFNDNSEVDNALKIGLSVAGGVALLAAVGTLGFFSCKKHQRDQELKKQQDALLNKPAAINPTGSELTPLKQENQSSSWGCQIF